jgi:hypothetical protein
MIKYRVCLQRYIEQTVEVEVEADNIEAAVEAAEAMVGDDTLPWVAGGEDIHGAAAEIGQPAYAATGGDEYWNRP